MTDDGFTLHDLDAAIEMSRSLTERERQLVEVLPKCSTRERRKQALDAMQENLRRLVALRAALKVRRRPGTRLH